MKKTILLAAFVIATICGYAQKPVAGKKTAEVNLNFQTGTAGISYGLPQATGYSPAELRFRFFQTDNTALRLRFGLASRIDKSAVSNGVNTADITEKTGFGFSISPGLERHFEGTKKLSPFVGAQLGIMFGGGSSVNVTNSAYENPSANDVKPSNKYNKKNGATFGVGLGLIMGADYYFTEGIYLGAEFGLSLVNYSSTADGKISKTENGTTTELRIIKSSTLDLFGVNTGGLRIGFVF